MNKKNKKTLRLKRKGEVKLEQLEEVNGGFLAYPISNTLSVGPEWDIPTLDPIPTIPGFPGGNPWGW